MNKKEIIFQIIGAYTDRLGNDKNPVRIATAPDRRGAELLAAQYARAYGPGWCFYAAGPFTVIDYH